MVKDRLAYVILVVGLGMYLGLGIVILLASQVR